VKTPTPCGSTQREKFGTRVGNDCCGGRGGRGSFPIRVGGGSPQESLKRTGLVGWSKKQYAGGNTSPGNLVSRFNDKRKKSRMGGDEILPPRKAEVGVVNKELDALKNITPILERGRFLTKTSPM